MNILSCLPGWLDSQLSKSITNPHGGRTQKIGFPPNLIDTEFDVLIVFVSTEVVKSLLEAKAAIKDKHLILIYGSDSKNEMAQIRKVFEATQIDRIDLEKIGEYSLTEEEVGKFASAINNLSIAI